MTEKQKLLKGLLEAPLADTATIVACAIQLCRRMYEEGADTNTERFNLRKAIEGVYGQGRDDEWPNLDTLFDGV